MTPNVAALEKICADLLVAIGEDPHRDGLRDTPRRWANFWREFVDYRAGALETTFDAVTASQMVVVSGIRAWSLCEHHLLPFSCDVAVGYIAADKVIGLSKIPRIVQRAAHRLQLQERFVAEIADDVARVTGSGDVAVFATGQHLCMQMRGAKSDAVMRTSVMRGVFLTEADARAEFLELARR